MTAWLVNSTRSSCAVLVGIDLLELAHDELAADVVGQQALGLRPVGRPGQHGIFLLAQPAVVVLVELVGFAQLHVDEVVDRRHALAAARLDLLALGRLARHRALHDQADLGLGHLVVAVRVVLVELGMHERLGLGALDEAVAIGVEVLEFGPRAVLALLEVRPVGHVRREGRLGDLDELLERELAVLVDVEFLERLHAVFQELGARDLALLVGVDLDEPLRQRHRWRRADSLLGRRRAWSRGRTWSRRSGRLRLGRRRRLRGLRRLGGWGGLVRRPIGWPALCWGSLRG